MNYSFVQVFLDCCHRWTRTFPLEKGVTILMCPHAGWLVTIAPQDKERAEDPEAHGAHITEAPEPPWEKP